MRRPDPGRLQAIYDDLFLKTFSTLVLILLFATGEAVQAGGVVNSFAPPQLLDTEPLGPFGLTVDNRGQVYASGAKGKQVQKFDHNGQFLAAINGDFSHPDNLTTDTQANLYVSDWGKHTIQKFDPDGKLLARWGGEGQFERPAGVVVNSKNELVVVDGGNNRFQKFAATGQFLASWPIKVVTQQNYYKNTYGLAVDKQDNLYLSFNISGIQKYSADGQYLTAILDPRYSEINAIGNGPAKVAVDRQGYLFLCVDDINNTNLYKFNASGRLVLERAYNNISFGRITSVAVDVEDNFYVAESSPHRPRIVKFNRNGDKVVEWQIADWKPNDNVGSPIFVGYLMTIAVCTVIGLAMLVVIIRWVRSELAAGAGRRR